MKTFERLDNCPHIKLIALTFPKSAPTFPNSVSVSKICTSGDLHGSIQGPAMQIAVWFAVAVCRLQFAVYLLQLVNSNS